MDNFNAAQEVESVIKEISFAVKEALINESDPTRFSITVLENINFQIRLSESGFFVEKQTPDHHNPALEGKCFETIYSFLDTASPLYRDKFVTDLTSKLEKIQK